jgi:hypothetical protein
MSFKFTRYADQLINLLRLRKNMKISKIFEDEPKQWGLRGDRYLWREIRARLESTEMPESPEQLREIIENEYEITTGHSIGHKEHFQIERFMHGGMSSGGISPDFWINCGIPILIKRHAEP